MSIYAKIEPLDISGEIQALVIRARDKEDLSPNRLMMWNKDNEELIENTLLTSGVVIAKGFNISTPNIFSSLVNNIKYKYFPYNAGNAPRETLGANVYSASEWSQDHPISLHNENSCDPYWADILYFACQQPASSGGGTILADSRNVLTRLSSETKRYFKKRNIKYIRNLNLTTGVGLSWAETFRTTSKSMVESICREKNIAFEWKGNGDLYVEQIGSPTAIHSVTGECVWFNQAHQYHPSNTSPDYYYAIRDIYGDDFKKWPTAVCLDDNSEIDKEILDDIRSSYRKSEVLVNWEKGDVVYMDNTLIAHGRAPFRGDRKIMLSMAEY